MAASGQAPNEDVVSRDVPGAGRAAAGTALAAACGYRYWLPTRDSDPRVLGLWRRHYTWNPRRRGTSFGPGEKLVLVTSDGRAAWVWRYQRYRLDGQKGVCCAFFRNESDVLSSELVREACAWAWRRWPGQRLFTLVNPRRVRSPNPGYCFQAAGWRRAGQTRDGLIVLEILPERRGEGQP
jgi:hypothetical protein